MDSSIFLPLVREFNLWLLLKINYKSANGDFTGTTIYRTLHVALGHAFFLTYTVGSIATFESSLVIVAEDFVVNLAICVNIIRLYHKEESQQNNKKIVELLQLLAINEWIEYIVPLFYISVV